MKHFNCYITLYYKVLLDIVKHYEFTALETQLSLTSVLLESQHYKL